MFSKSDKRLVCYPCAFTQSEYTVPQGIEIIGNQAFYLCSGLTSITLPDSLTTIGERAFSNCSNLTSITLPDSLTAIGEEAFARCDNAAFIVSRDSWARQYCIDNDLPYTYPDANDWLNN